MIYKFYSKEPGKAYISNRLWLPKSRNQGDGLVRPGPVKRALEFKVQNQGGQQEFKLWDETHDHIITPREFLTPAHYSDYSFPFIDARPEFDTVEFEDLVVPRNEEQERAWAALAVNDNGILNLACGKGKTKLSLKKIAQRGTPTLVVVPDGGLLDQWVKSVQGDDRTPPGLRFDGKVGIIQGSTFDWKHPLTIALVTTLGIRIRDGKLPEELFRYFGLIVYDEVHQLGAPMFSLTAPPFYGDRIGLTATIEREDGLDPIYRYHIGEPFYTDLSQSLVPRIYFQQTPASIPHQLARINGITNISVLRTMMGTDAVGNIFRYWTIKKALDEGRKIICLSHSKAQLRLFHAMFPGSGLIISETDRATRTSVLRNSQICFAIAKLGSTGVDDDRLDTLFWLTPFRSRIALQQSMGRIQREHPSKMYPVMVVFEDWMVNPLRKLCQNLRTKLKEWNYKFETLKPNNLPRELPPDVLAAYEAAYKLLTPEDEDGADEPEAEGY